MMPAEHGAAVVVARPRLSCGETRARIGQSTAQVASSGLAARTIAPLRRLAAALDSDVHLNAGHDLGSVWSEPHAA